MDCCFVLGHSLSETAAAFLSGFVPAGLLPDEDKADGADDTGLRVWPDGVSATLQFPE